MRYVCLVLLAFFSHSNVSAQDSRWSGSLMFGRSTDTEVRQDSNDKLVRGLGKIESVSGRLAQNALNSIAFQLAYHPTENAWLGFELTYRDTNVFSESYSVALISDPGRDCLSALQGPTTLPLHCIVDTFGGEDGFDWANENGGEITSSWSMTGLLKLGYDFAPKKRFNPFVSVGFGAAFLRVQFPAFSGNTSEGVPDLLYLADSVEVAWALHASVGLKIKFLKKTDLVLSYSQDIATKARFDQPHKAVGSLAYGYRSGEIKAGLSYRF